ncbi:hypothetical protein RCC89_07690 [Cytophagaceae bacterium ABcell3]|nr:hypothetical protein RCC89_07690 [Cytophagaceae bacterium ABcell3]
MKIKIAVLIIMVFLHKSINVIAQNDTVVKREYVAYTLAFNSVPDHFNYPLFGFVNVARGNHKGFQLGFVNTTLQGFTGLKVGFVNTILRDFSGFNVGFVNTVSGNSEGGKIGFVNTSLEDGKGLRVGYVNTTLGNALGAKFGFVNTTLGNSEGLQLGFVNIARQEMKGAQIGFVNVADTVSGGTPIGFLSIVKRGGYRAVEMSANELYPLNMAFKLGVPRFYSFFQGSYNASYEDPFALAFGFGSLISLGNNFYFNPELGNVSPLAISANNVTTFAANVRYSLSPRFQVSTGLSAVWLNYPRDENMYAEPFFALINHEISARNRVLVGARVGLSYNFTELVR